MGAAGRYVLRFGAAWNLLQDIVFATAVLLQLYLAPSPATAKCLKPEERVWLEQQQNNAIAARHAVSGHFTVRGQCHNNFMLLCKTAIKFMLCPASKYFTSASSNSTALLEICHGLPV